MICMLEGRIMGIKFGALHGVWSGTWTGKCNTLQDLARCIDL